MVGLVPVFFAGAFFAGGFFAGDFFAGCFFVAAFLGALFCFGFWADDDFVGAFDPACSEREREAPERDVAPEREDAIPEEYCRSPGRSMAPQQISPRESGRQKHRDPPGQRR